MAELGTTVPLAINIFDATGSLVVPTAISLTINLPDGTTDNPTPLTVTTGVYFVDYLPPIVGHYSYKFASTDPDASYVDNFTVTDTSAELVSLTDVKRHLNIVSTTNDDELARIRDAAQTSIEGYTNRVWSASASVRLYSTDSTDRIPLPWGTTSVSAVSERGVPLTQGTDYLFDPVTSILYRRAGSLASRYWIDGTLNVSVTFATGGTPAPDDIRQAILEMTRHLWATQRGGNKSNVVGSGDEFNPATTYSIPRRVQELLDPYVLPGLA